MTSVSPPQTDHHRGRQLTVTRLGHTQAQTPTNLRICLEIKIINIQVLPGKDFCPSSSKIPKVSWVVVHYHLEMLSSEERMVVQLHSGCCIKACNLDTRIMTQTHCSIHVSHGTRGTIQLVTDTTCTPLNILLLPVKLTTALCHQALQTLVWVMWIRLLLHKLQTRNWEYIPAFKFMAQFRCQMSLVILQLTFFPSSILPAKSDILSDQDYQPSSFIPCWAAMAEATYRRRSLIAIPSSPPRPQPPTPSPPSSPPTSPLPPYYPQEWPQQVQQEKIIHETILHHIHIIQQLSLLIKTLLNSRKRNKELPKLDLMEYHSKESQEKVLPPTCGNFYLNCYRTKNVVPDTSSGQTERRASSSLWTARLYPDCGDYTRTNRTWITRLWAEHSGMNSLTYVSLILLSNLHYIDFDSKSFYSSKFRVGLQRK